MLKTIKKLAYRIIKQVFQLIKKQKILKLKDHKTDLQVFKLFDPTYGTISKLLKSTYYYYYLGYIVPCTTLFYP